MTASKAATEAQPASTAKTTTLSLKRVGIDTYRENVAYLHRDCAIYRAEGFQALAKIEVQHSIPALHRKIAGERLSRDDFASIVQDIAAHRYSKIELTAFVVACNQGELDREEVFFLSDAMELLARVELPFDQLTDMAQNAGHYGGAGYERL